MIIKLKSRYQQITNKETDVTIVFDRGNNCDDNITELEEQGFPLHGFPLHYVGGLKRNQSTELFAIPQTEYTDLHHVKLSFYGSDSTLNDPVYFTDFIAKMYQKEWVTCCKL